MDGNLVIKMLSAGSVFVGSLIQVLRYFGIRPPRFGPKKPELVKRMPVDCNSGACPSVVVCRAVVLGHQGGSDGIHHFEIERCLAKMPAIEVVKRFISHLKENDYLMRSYEFQFDTVKNLGDRGVVMAIGHVAVKGHRMPLTITFSEEANPRAAQKLS